MTKTIEIIISPQGQARSRLMQWASRDRTVNSPLDSWKRLSEWWERSKRNLSSIKPFKSDSSRDWEGENHSNGGLVEKQGLQN